MAQLDNILIVEDSPDWADNYVRSLGSKPPMVSRIATNLSEALAAIREMAFGVALVDLALDPDDDGNEDGLQVMNEIVRLGDQTSIILITGVGGLEPTREAIIRYGAFDAISKAKVGPREIPRLVKAGLAAHADSAEVAQRDAIVDLFRGNLLTWDWEHQVLSALQPRGGAPTLKAFASQLFDRYLPCARPLWDTPLGIDLEVPIARAAYWSRGVGKPVAIFFGNEADFPSGAEREQQLERLLPDASLGSALTAYSKSNLVGVVYELKSAAREDFGP